MSKKRSKKLRKIFLCILLIVAIIAGIAVGLVMSKLSNLQMEKIDTSDLSVNEDLYNELADYLSKKEFRDIKTIALFGIDSRDSDYGGRSDTIIVAAINPKFKSIKLISIPRDTYVDVPGHGKTKINHAYAYGKEQLSIKTINENFGLNITEYVTIDFSGLIHVINKIGGVQMSIIKEEKDYIDSHSHESYAITGNTQKTLSGYGNVTLDGEQALTHSRNRTVGNDFTRAGRQREVIEAIMSKLSKKGASEILDMSETLLKEVKTNINVLSYTGLLTTILLNTNDYLGEIISLQVPSTDYANGQMIGGVYYFVSDSTTMRNDMIDNIYKK